MTIINLTDKNFDEIVENNHIVVIDFWAEWCQPCLAFSAIYEEVAEQFPEITFTKINTKEEPELAKDFAVRSIPLVMILKDRVAIYSESGTMPASTLIDLIKQAKQLDIEQVKKQIEE